jgi:hypothetical protein
MKKILFILLIISSILANAQSPAYSKSNISILKQGIFGVMTFNYKNFDPVTCPNRLYNGKLEFRYGTSGSWTTLFENDLISGGYNGYVSVGTNSSSTYRNKTHFTINDLPGDFFSRMIQLRFTGQYYKLLSFSCSFKIQNVDLIYDYNTDIPPVINLTADIDAHCTGTNIDFLKPSFFVNMTGLNDKYNVYRKLKEPNSTLEKIRTDIYGLHVFDQTAQKGKTYVYSVRPVIIYSDGRRAEGPEAEADGRTFGPPDNPSGLYLDQANCAGQIDVNWNWSASTNPDNFVIERSNNANFNSISSTLIVSGSDRSRRDANTISGNTYYYRVLAQYDCPNSTSVTKSGYAIAASQVGNGIPVAPTSVGVALTASDDINVTWNHTGNLEDGFKIIRQSPTGQVLYDAPADATNFLDQTADNCTPYTYAVKSYNSCKTIGVQSGPSSSIIIPASISAVFSASQKLTATDGEFGDKIELRWNTSNRQIDDWIITRTDLNTNISTIIGNPTGGTRYFVDNSASSNVLYEYEIIGETDCAGAITSSNTSKDVGFRLAYGTINGQVTFAGGTAVEGVKVTAEAATGASGKSGVFNGTNSYAKANNDPLLQSNELTVSAFIKPAVLTGFQVIASKHDHLGNGWTLYLADNILRLHLGLNHYNAINHTAIVPNNWFSVGAIVSSNSIKLFVNGDTTLFIDTLNNLSAMNTATDLYVGKQLNGLHFNGKIDEVRVFNNALTQTEFERLHDVYINPSYNGLVAYWRFDEGFGSTGFDYSKTNQTLNANNLSLTNVSFLNDFPTTTQLTAGAYTNDLGSYYIPFIPFLGNGDNFLLRPELGSHNFSPSTKSLFIGGTSPNFSGIDFLDNSSFNVSGFVTFDNTNGNTCPSENVFIQIDGLPVIQNGIPVKSDPLDGSFSLQVPIGSHVLTTSKASHVFSEGRWPQTGAHNFQSDIINIQFKDATLLNVIGRVAGGAKQAALPQGFDFGKNNIGQSTITFQAPCFTATVTTNHVTGLYSIDLPPLSYDIPPFSPTHNSSASFNSNTPLNLKSLPQEKELIDTLSFIPDTLIYNVIRDFIYYTSPSLSVLSENLDLIYGEAFIEYNNQVSTVQIPGDKFQYPIFIENDEYKWKIQAYEEYFNYDSGIELIDNVPIREGTFTFTNELANPKSKIVEFKPEDNFDGSLDYTFKAGQANTSASPSPNEQYSFTKTFSLSVVSKEGNFNPVTYQHYPTQPLGSASIFRGIVFGGKSFGNSYTSSGPEVVTMILRDPPGTNSFSTWAQDVSFTKTTSFEVTGGIGKDFESEAKIGTKFETGLGYSTESEFSVGIQSKLNVSSSISDKNEFIESITRSTSISTGNGDEFVGPNADLFFGRSMNMEFGLAHVISVSKLSDCGGNIECFGASIVHSGLNYKFSRGKSLVVVPGGYETSFLYHQGFVESGIIPRLILLRNQLLSDPTKGYTSHFLPTDTDYGKSNDDLTLTNPSSIDPFEFEVKDTNGLSYTYTGLNYVTRLVEIVPGDPMVNSSAFIGVDSVWWFNQQIALWQDALRKNEAAKFNGDLETNISYSGGSILTNSVVSKTIDTDNNTISLALDEELTLKIVSVVGASGTESSSNLKMKLETKAELGTSEDRTTTFSYTIDDPGSYDDFTFDVFKPRDGYGPIFRTKAGQTQCPFQDEEVTKYYNPGTVINAKTIAVDQPRALATPPVLFNVPADGQGAFTITLYNDALVDNVYTLTILESSNPNGAILEIDGEIPNRDYAIAAGTSISKTLVIQKGPYHINYDSIALVFHSRCQYSFNSSNWVDLADTVYVSVNFLPACTDIEISNPSDQFVINNSYDNKIPFIISGYDINYGGLDKIGLQYKPASQSTWIPLVTEWFMDSSGTLATVPPHSDPKEIPKDRISIDNYSLNIKGVLTDQEYQFRATSTCNIPGNTPVTEYSDVIGGVVDRINPNVFGVPSPGDGVLDPNDNISIKFNEAIAIGELDRDNFQITAVLNGQTLTHDKTVDFDGSTGYLEIANGFDFASGSFTIEFYAKRDQLGTEQSILSQGINSDYFNLGFGADDKLILNIGGSEYKSGFTVLDDTLWRHYSVSYDRENSNLELVTRDPSMDWESINTIFFTNYTGGGKTFIGRKSDNSNFFSGSMHQFRIWNRYFSKPQITSRKSENMSGREAGLIAYWPMDEGRGLLAEDKSRFRHAEMHANWEINPKGSSASFNGVNQYAILTNAGSLSIPDESDLSIEFWFKTQGGSQMTFLSNGSARFINFDHNVFGWSIEMDANNVIHVKNDSVDFIAVNTDYADNTWHHFALVLNRLTNTTAYIDGVQQNSVNSNQFSGFGGTQMAIGARYALIGSRDSIDHFFNGNMDEIRIWNSARLRESLELDMFNRLAGNEFGLLAYYPFESYQEVLGVPLLTPTFTDEADSLDLTAVNGIQINTETAAIALQRPVQNIRYSTSVNVDEIVITPIEDPEVLENVTVNVTVKKVNDLQGNEMKSPKTWIAYVNKNQVLWQDAQKNLVKELNDTLTFTSQVINSGGENKNYTISNLPFWLTASPISGSIAPISSQTILFTVNTATNIGKFSEDILLATDFGYNEKLLVNLKVEKTPPALPFDPTLFQNSMSIIGQIRINDKISVNEDDKLVALINDSIRGVANLQYLESYDKHVAFLDVYANASDSIHFQVWNASKGELHIDVQPNIYFIPNGLIGSPNSPQFFDAEDKVSKPIVLTKGWNWVSFPLNDENMPHFLRFIEALAFDSSDVIKTSGQNMAAVRGTTDWTGPELKREGFVPNKSYLVKISQTDTIDFKGFAFDPDTVGVDVVTGWNRIGFVSLKNMTINTALSNYAASTGDLLKSQQQFAYYDQNLGWIGSLQSLEPTKGYLLKSNGTNASFVYPRLGLLRLKAPVDAPSFESTLPISYHLNPNDFEASTSAIIKVVTCEEIITDTTYGLAAFHNNEFRGWATSAKKLDDKEYRYFITAYGSGTDYFSFALVNRTTKERIDLKGNLEFQKNQLEGTPSSPLILDLMKKIDCDQFKSEPTKMAVAVTDLIYPNPFTDEINLLIPAEMDEQTVVSLIDANGRIIYSENSNGQHQLTWSSISFGIKLSSGVYQIRFMSKDKVIVKKVVKL